MKKRIIPVLLLFSAMFILSSWGDRGHSMISFRINLSLNDEMDQFQDWIFYLSEHASDADHRKKDDPEEGPNHYIDIDNYTSFQENGTIPHELQECIETYGAGFVEDNGYLPWATLAMYDSVVLCMSKGDWNGAKRFAADLGHYVADGHMPMHLTRNYDGQYSGNKGIHFRYEIEMIDRYHSKIMYEGTPSQLIQDPSEYIFSYIYENYKYKDSILIADDYARELSNDAFNDQYYMALWERTEHLTIEMFSRASHALAELIYSAWIEAGRPQEKVPVAQKTEIAPDISGLRIFPNPVRTNAYLSFFNHSSEELSGTVYNSTGQVAMQINLDHPAIGHQVHAWDPATLSEGRYFLVLHNENSLLSEPFTLVR